MATSLKDLVSPGVPRWRTLAEAAQARQEVAAAALGNLIYVAGGLTAAGATDAVEVYDIAKNKWFAAPKLPVKVHHAMAAAYAETIWVIGGFDAANRPSSRTFFLNKTQWIDGPRLSEGRAGGAALAFGTKLYVIAGQGSGRLVSVVEVLDKSVTPLRWVVGKSPIPTPRHHVAAASDGKHVYVSGGRRPAGGPSDSNVNAFERYNPATDAWEKLLNTPTARSGHGSGLFDGKVVVVGGEDPKKLGQPSISTTEEYDPVRNIWSRSLPGMFRARHGVGAVVVSKKLYVMLGGSRAGLAATKDSDVLVRP